MAGDKASLNDLKLGSEKLEGADFDEIPENLGRSFPDPPQPGKYRFKFPASLAAIWATVTTTDYGTRVNAIFNGDTALQIVQSPGSGKNGEDFETRLSNVPRPRGKEKILVSDMDLLLRAKGVTKRPKTNKEYAEALMKQAGQDFGAAIEWSWRCNPDREIYVDDGNGATAKVEGKMGCGARYYQRDVPKVDGVFPVRITCSNPECNANIRAFANLGDFSA